MKISVNEETLETLLEKVDKIECRISNAKSLNSGFDKLMIEIEHIKETQSAVLEAVRAIKKNLYEPYSGLFSRVKELEIESQRRWEYILETKPILEEHKELSLWKIQADKDLEDLEHIKMEVSELRSWKEGITKVIWLIATAAGAMWIKHFMDMAMK